MGKSAKLRQQRRTIVVTNQQHNVADQVAIDCSGEYDSLYNQLSRNYDLSNFSIVLCDDHRTIASVPSNYNDLGDRDLGVGQYQINDSRQLVQALNNHLDDTQSRLVFDATVRALHNGVHILLLRDEHNNLRCIPSLLQGSLAPIAKQAL